MSDTVDLTWLTGALQEVTRELRLIRLQLDLVARPDEQLTAVGNRVGAIERSFHDLVGEISRGFGQMQQQLTRQEKQVDIVDAGLTTLRTEIAANTDRIIAVLRERP